MRIKSISYAGKADVYNMEVKDTHNFAVENGAIVHNCYDEFRYVCMEMPIAAPVVRKAATPGFDPLNLFSKQKQVKKLYDL